MVPALLLFVYTLALTFVVFQLSIGVNVLILGLHLVLLVLLHVRIKKIGQSLRRIVPFLLLIILTSTLFTPGTVFFSFTLFLWPVHMTYEGLWLGSSVTLSFLVLSSTALFYQVPLFLQSLRVLAQTVPFLLPLFLSYVFIGGADTPKKQKKKLSLTDRFLVHRYVEDTMTDLVNTVGKDRQLPPRVLLITAVSLLLFSLKVIRILPGVPFASGQKLVIILPLLFFVAQKGGGFSATFTAFHYSLLSLLFGQQGYLGVLEIIRTIILGVLVDISVHVLPKRGFLLFLILTLFGGVLGYLFGVFSAFLLSALHVPSVIYLLYGPRIVTNTVFGLFSGSLSYYLMGLDFSLEKYDKTPYNKPHAKNIHSQRRSSKAHQVQPRRRNTP